MNKKEIEDMLETLTKQWGDTDNYVNDLLSYSKNLQQENQELKQEKEKLLKSMLKAHLDLKKDGEYSEFKAGAIAMLTSIMEEIKEIENGDSNE